MGIISVVGEFHEKMPRIFLFGCLEYSHLSFNMCEIICGLSKETRLYPKNPSVSHSFRTGEVLYFLNPKPDFADIELRQSCHP